MLLKTSGDASWPRCSPLLLRQDGSGERGPVLSPCDLGSVGKKAEGLGRRYC